MPLELQILKDQLISAIKLSGERSYARRKPRRKSIPILEGLICDLERFVTSNPSDGQAWDLLSLAYECLLRYSPAAVALRRSIELKGAATNKDLKRLARLREYEEGWVTIGITPDQLKRIGDYLEGLVPFNSNVEREPLKNTEEWLKHNAPDCWEELMDRIRRAGHHSDFSVLNNLVRG